MSTKKSKTEQMSKEAQDPTIENSQNNCFNLDEKHVNYSELYNKAKLYSPISKLQEKWKLIPAFLQVRGLMKMHIDSFNYFTDIEIKNIVRSERNYKIKSEINKKFYLKYHDIHIDYPTIEEEVNMSASITPHECRLRNLTYCSPILVNISYTLDGITERMINNVKIGKMPIMLGSNHCRLKGKNYKELIAMKECPYDPRGYFIINGVEKVILMHEQMSQNRIIVEHDSKGNIFSANVTSYSQDTKSRTSVIYKNSIFYVKANRLKNSVNLFVIFRAFNILSDQEIVMLIGQKHKQYLLETIADCHNLNIFTREDALNYLSLRINVSQKENEGKAINETINKILIAHIPVIRGNYHPKALFFALMTKKLINALNDTKKLDDKDYFGNKRLELAGNMIAILFEDLFKKYNSDLKKNIEQALLKNEHIDIENLMKNEIISHGLINSIATGNWNLKRFNMYRTGITEVLNRMTYISSLGMMTRLNPHFEKTRKISGPRALHPSQWGIICPNDTPDGNSCGLVKNLALLAHVTTSQNEKSIINLCINLGAEDISNNPLIDGDEDENNELKLAKTPSERIKKLNYNLKKNFIIYVNGTPIGLTSTPNEFCNKFRKCRRKGFIHEFVSIYCNIENLSINIACDSGRLIRPYIRVEKGKPLVTSNDIKLLENKSITFSSLIKCGKIEYLDVNEENNALVAIDEKWIKPETTHMEMSQFSIFGVVAGVIPYPHHNQSPRNTYQCSMGKQAIGIVGYNQLIRSDTLLYLMIYPQKPLVKTVSIEISNYEKLPAGQNASVAIMSYSGYDIEDAVVLNKASLDRGFGRIMTLKRLEAEFQTYSNGTKDIRHPPELKPSSSNIGHYKSLHAIDKDGLPFIGAELSKGDIYVNRYTPCDTKSLDINKNEMQFRQSALYYKDNYPSYVDRVLYGNNPKTPELIKIIMRQTRRPELGDKFSSRHGQKGVCGIIVQQEDMPFNEQGWCPDLIMNPHGFPSRMTVGQLIELIASKTAALDGKYKYGTAFAGDSPEDLGNILIAHGFSYSGKDILYSGLTGEPLNCFIFNGPIFYQRLKHMVVDKMHGRSTGPKTSLTRQPMEGRSKEGGLRLGEMERDCLVGFGASCLLLERLMLSSDLFLASICGKCGYLGMKGFCQYCGDGSNMSDIKMPYAFKLLTQELMSMNIKVKFKTANL
jgi:DNA-directed RNA polymerase III subunit RPC2